ncbi:hypothetical protein Barb4_05247 [Bacteroidales bacterium Barb4]|nr:hypothetical protein Barb4_05247 [Bacteroidales bacterium Barb4]
MGDAGNLAIIPVGNFPQDKMTAVILPLRQGATQKVVGVFRAAAVAAADGFNLSVRGIGIGNGAFGSDGRDDPVEAVVSSREGAPVGVRFPDDVACSVVFYEAGAEGRVCLTCGTTVFVVVKNGRDIALCDGLFGIAVGAGEVLHRAGRVADGGHHFHGAVFGGFPRCGDCFGDFMTVVGFLRHAAFRGDALDGAVVFVVKQGVKEDGSVSFSPNGA